jgi:hypothetical protein
LINGFRYRFNFQGSHLRETLSVLVVLLFSITAYSQHSKREFAVSFAAAGQHPIAITGDDRSGFWRKPIILNLRYQVATDYVTSASLFLEYIGETRTRRDLWSDSPNALDPPPYNADITESLSMTVLGLQGARTLLRFGDFRLAFTLGAGYGLGSASADVRKIATGQTKSFESCDIWHGVYLAGSLRTSYTVYQAEKYDIGLTASLRTWGFTTIGSFGDCLTSYNGPNFTALYEIGYLAGVSIGFF